MENVLLGKVVKLHGYLGQFKVSTKFDDDFDISKIKIIFDENENSFLVKRIFKVKDGAIMALENVDGEKAKLFLNKNIYVDREIFKDKILIEDLKNAEVFFENGTKIGKIIDIQDYGSADVFFLKNEIGKEILFSNVKGLIEKFDLNNHKLIINETKFYEVSDED